MAVTSSKGFTLIEILVVIAIIGILAAIAIPQFSAYRKKAYNASAITDIRSGATAQEAYYVVNGRYAGSLENLTKAPDFGTSPFVTMIVDADQGSYTLRAFHSSGNKTYVLVGPGGSITSE